MKTLAIFCLLPICLLFPHTPKRVLIKNYIGRVLMKPSLLLLLVISGTLLMLGTEIAFSQQAGNSFIFPVRGDNVTLVYQNTLDPRAGALGSSRTAPTPGGWYDSGNIFGARCETCPCPDEDPNCPEGQAKPFHPGVDYNRYDTEEDVGDDVPVYSIGNGTVIRIPHEMGSGLGWSVFVRYDFPDKVDLSEYVKAGTTPTPVIKNAEGVVAAYLHLSGAGVPGGMYCVNKGTILGYIKSAIGHLHFELRAVNSTVSDDEANREQYDDAFNGYYASLQAITNHNTIDPNKFLNQFMVGRYPEVGWEVSETRHSDEFWVGYLNADGFSGLGSVWDPISTGPDQVYPLVHNWPDDQPTNPDVLQIQDFLKVGRDTHGTSNTRDDTFEYHWSRLVRNHHTGAVFAVKDAILSFWHDHAGYSSYGPPIGPEGIGEVVASNGTHYYNARFQQFRRGTSGQIYTIFINPTNQAAEVTTRGVSSSLNPVDVFFIVDLSGSFTDDLAAFKAQAQSIITTLNAVNPDTRFGLARFEDYPIYPFGDPASGDKAYERLIDLTSDSDAVLGIISGLSVRYGYDTSQSQLAALYQAATGSGQDLSSVGYPEASIPPNQQANFRDGATKLILLWTDADFHQPGDPGAIPYPGPSFAATASAILALDPPKVIGISSGGGGIADLQAIGFATGALAPSGGVDCDNDGIVDILEGDPLVCGIAPTGEGIASAVVAIVKAASAEQVVNVDIRPGSCPNPLNIREKGVLPVALLGSSKLDVTSIDVGSLRLAGVPPLHTAIEDVSAPPSNLNTCNTYPADGFADLILMFDAQEIMLRFGILMDGDSVELTLTGKLEDGTPIVGKDTVMIRSRKK